ncbi:MAG: hypothetical protein ABI608_00145 [Rhizomicrobium sp.]
MKLGRTHGFPLNFESLRTISGGKARSYIIGALFTASYSEKAARLIASCEKFGLPYILCEVAAVHRSIGSRGIDDLSCTKPNFIHHLLAKYGKPILYVDADCEIASEPVLIDQLVETRCDFAIYNKYADREYTPTFARTEVRLAISDIPISDRFLRYFKQGETRWYTTAQLKCFGCVQLYRNSLPARAMLSKWHQAIAEFPGSGDDRCLDFAFNNLSRRSWRTWRMKIHWLPAAYARLPYWIFTKPVINHPDFPGSYANFVPIRDPKGRKEYYLSSMTPRTPLGPLEENCIIDTEQHRLYRLVNDRLVPFEPMNQTLWI